MMHAIRRSCRAAVLGSNALLSIANGSRRAFSQSATYRRAALPVYLEASSPELSRLLSTLNSRVLLPKFLTPEQEKLVYKPENRAKLESEPIEITLGDVTLPLEHIDRNKDVPSYKKHFQHIVKASKTPEDWENVLRALEGYVNAGLKLGDGQKIMAVRYLNSASLPHLILKGLQRPKATGLHLRRHEFIVSVMRSARDRAWLAGWQKSDLKKALSMAEQIVELMDNSEHLGGKLPPTQFDWRAHPIVVAVPLEMAAELAYRHDGDTEKVRKYAFRLMNALKQTDFLSAQRKCLSDVCAKTESDFKYPLLQVKTLVRLQLELVSLIPVWNSLSTARTVLDAEMPMAEDAERVQRELRDALETGVQAMERLNIRKDTELSQPSGYIDYVKNAIKSCEEEDGVESEEEDEQ